MSTQSPAQTNYDVVIVGGAIMGASAAWFLSDDKDFDGSVLVVDRDLTYENTSTMHTNSCMRQQFSTELNVRISQFAADFVKNLRSYLGDDERVPELSIRSFGYMYLADTYVVDSWLGLADPDDDREIARPAMLVIDPDGREVYRYVGRDFADRTNDDPDTPMARFTAAQGSVQVGDRAHAPEVVGDHDRRDAQADHLAGSESA